mmetsp:Transcript_11970/g.31008  ORF Transcript_11970/g.31008 Transcript_11970/m.31008 type:complete len:236 (-) Transcript_11970:298-1005(-)
MVLNLLLLIWCSTGLPLGSRPKCEGGNATQKKMRLEGLANGEDRVAGERLVDEHARDAHHGGAAVVALGVELERLHLGVVVAHPRVERDVARLAVGVLRLGREAGARLLHAGEHHDLQPARGGDGLERREAARRDVLELEVLRRRQVARHADARLDGDDVEEAKHGRAAVLDLHDLVAAHVARLDQAERVEDAQRREDTDVTLREHLDRRERLDGDRRREGDDLKVGKGDNGGHG